MRWPERNSWSRLFGALFAGLIALLIGLPANAESVHPGRTVVEGAQCAVCHVVPEVSDPGRLASCVGCHAWVKSVAANPAARTKAMQFFPKWERYERNVKSYAAVPDLSAAFARLDAPWLVGYLADPHDLRPNMPETMVRVGLGAEALRQIAAWAGTMAVVPPPAPAPLAANVERGAKLFVERGCTGCHDFGAVHTEGVLPAAPDLRWARERMSDDMIVAWILDPQKISSRASMPNVGVLSDEAVALRDYLVLAEPGGQAPAPLMAVKPLVASPRWPEVESKVFGKICIHCHMDPAQNEGRAGPGNAGGFGWESTGLELQNYETVAANGKRILDAVHRREAEEARDHVAPGQIPAAIARPAKPGMPLGLPALPPQDIALLESWYAAGAPQ